MYVCTAVVRSGLESLSRDPTYSSSAFGIGGPIYANVPCHLSDFWYRSLGSNEDFEAERGEAASKYPLPSWSQTKIGMRLSI